MRAAPPCAAPWGGGQPRADGRLPPLRSPSLETLCSLNVLPSPRGSRPVRALPALDVAPLGHRVPALQPGSAPTACPSQSPVQCPGRALRPTGSTGSSARCCGQRCSGGGGEWGGGGVGVALRCASARAPRSAAPRGGAAPRPEPPRPSRHAEPRTDRDNKVLERTPPAAS